MNPLDLLKVKFQVTTTNPSGNLGKNIWLSLKDIQQSQGWKGLYRGIIPNIAGNASSWGLYFLLCVTSLISGIPRLDLYLKLQHAQKACFRWRYYKTTLSISIPHMFCSSEFALLNLRNPGFHVLTRCPSSFYRRCDGHHHQPPVACPSADVYIAS